MPHPQSSWDLCCGPLRAGELRKAWTPRPTADQPISPTLNEILLEHAGGVVTPGSEFAKNKAVWATQLVEFDGKALKLPLSGTGGRRLDNFAPRTPRFHSKHSPPPRGYRLWAPRPPFAWQKIHRQFCGRPGFRLENAPGPEINSDKAPP